MPSRVTERATLRPWLGVLNRRIDVGAWYPRDLPVPAATLVSVYRQANAANLTGLASLAERHGWDVRLWALDAPAPALETWTLGSGPGTRFELINKLVDTQTLPAQSYLVVTDDDVTFERGDLAAFLAIAARAGADFAQPAHTAGSVHSWRFTLSAPRTVARRTSFIEIGPVFSMSPRARSAALPFPAEGMGWGVEFAWSALQEAGLSLAIIDAVTVCHHGSVAAGYELHEELAHLELRARQAGHTSLTELQVELARWRPWRRRPSLLRPGGRLASGASARDWAS